MSSKRAPACCSSSVYIQLTDHGGSPPCVLTVALHVVSRFPAARAAQRCARLRAKLADVLRDSVDRGLAREARASLGHCCAQTRASFGRGGAGESSSAERCAETHAKIACADAAAPVERRASGCGCAFALGVAAAVFSKRR
jgi:hypothetical protein